jgi:transposase
MDVLYPRCGGLDVHKDVVVACARVVVSAKVQRDVKSFATTTRGLMEMSEWLEAHGCTHVVMEATGVYWKPVWHVLEGSFELLLANAQHVRNVPGRKSDVNDAMWLSDLLAHGLVRGSFVPPQGTQEVRDLTRTRKQLAREVVQHTNRIEKILEDANIKIASAISDLLGMSGRRILDALVGGETDPEKLVQLTSGRLKAPRKVLIEALRGNFTAHHQFLLKLHLSQLDQLQKGIREVESRLGDLEPFRVHIDNLTTIPGIGDIAAYVIAGEVGVDMSRFATPSHLISWAGLCPRLDESAGKHRSRRVRKGAPWLKTTLVSAAWSAVKSRGTYLQAQFQRLRARRGPKKAIMAVAASMLTAAFFILRDRVVYRDLGAEHFNRHDKRKAAERLQRRLEALGFAVDLRPAAEQVSI